jgi:hypothetical protein
MALIAKERAQFHKKLLSDVISLTNGVPSNADTSNTYSVSLSKQVIEILGKPALSESKTKGQTLGNRFEEIVRDFVSANFLKLPHLRPGPWEVKQITGRGGLGISAYQQYAHLIDLDKAARQNRALAAALGHDYSISPDIVVLRMPLPDEVINSGKDAPIVNEKVSRLSGLRLANNNLPILHASISCKFTIRSDRSQNARTEALNLIRNRKGKLPHIAVVTAECLPSRLASLALGTGDIDCLYHFALDELRQAVNSSSHEDAKDMLATLFEGHRIKDISDLPLDLAA